MLVDRTNSSNFVVDFQRTLARILIVMKIQNINKNYV